MAASPNALVITSDADLRKHLQRTLDDAKCPSEVAENIDAASDLYDASHHSVIFLDLRDQPHAPCPFIDRSATQLVTIVDPNAPHTQSAALDLNADRVIDRLDEATLTVQCKLAVRHAAPSSSNQKSPSARSDRSSGSSVDMFFAEAPHMHTRALDSINNGVLISDARLPDYPVIYSNKAFERITGYSREDVLGTNCRFLQGPGTDPDAIDEIRQALQEERSCRTILKNYRKEGSPFWNELTLAPVRDEEGTVTHFIGVLHDITQRIRAEHALQVSEERWRYLAEHHPEPLLISIDGTIQYVNEAAVDTFGAERPGDLIGRSVFEFVDQDLHDRLQRRIDQINDGKQTNLFEHRLKRLDGETRIVQAFSAPITYAGDTAAQTVVRDITEQKQAQRELKSREQQQKAAAELGLYAMQESDLQVLLDEIAYRITEALEVDYCSLMELRPEDDRLVLRAGTGWPEELIDEATLRNTQDNPQGTALASGEPVVLENCQEACDNSRFDTCLSQTFNNAQSSATVPIQGPDGSFGVLSVHAKGHRSFSDDELDFLQTIAILAGNAIERKRTERELLLSETRYRTVVEQQTELICRFAPDMELSFVNHAYSNYVGHDVEDLVGQSFLDLIPESDHDVVHEALQSITSDDPVHRFELRLYDDSDTLRWVQWDVRAFFDEGGDVAEFQASGRDITERKELEREVLKISARERRRIGRDLHDGLGSHLSGVAMLCRGVIRKIEAGEDIQKDVIEEISQLVQESISQVRKLARGLNPVKMDDEGLTNALQELASSVEAYPDLNCTFEWDSNLPDPSSEVSTHLYRIAQEAINNALKHGEPAHIRLRLLAEDDTLVLRVADDGDGFQPSTGEKNGMGLRVMRYRANTIGAQLRIHSTPGDGTQVTCSLPFDKLHQSSFSPSQAVSDNVE